MLAIGALTLLGGLGAGAVVAVHELPQAGPFIANSLRQVIGIQGVANLEELVASAEDTVMRWRDQPSRSLSEMSPTIVGSDVPLAVAAPLAPAGIDANITRPTAALDPAGMLAP